MRYATEYLILNKTKLCHLRKVVYSQCLITLTHCYETFKIITIAFRNKLLKYDILL